MKILMLAFVFIGIAVIEVSRLLGKKRGREIVLALVLLGIGFTLSVLQILGVKVPNPNKGIEFLIKLFIPQ